MVTLSAEAATATVDSVGRASLNNEFVQIQSEIARIATQTNFNGAFIFTTGGFNGSVSVFVGDTKGASSISVVLQTITVSGNNVSSVGGQNLQTIDLTTAASAATSLTNIKAAIDGVAKSRAAIGSGINRLQSAVAVLQSQSQNTTAAESTIRDANIAQEVANLTKYQILAQSGISALAQANTNSEQVLGLLKR